jgi:hypothetical protein
MYTCITVSLSHYTHSLFLKAYTINVQCVEWTVARGAIRLHNLCAITYMYTDKAEQTDPGFVEKLVTQIVKNVQVLTLVIIIFTKLTFATLIPTYLLPL